MDSAAVISANAVKHARSLSARDDNKSGDHSDGSAEGAALASASAAAHGTRIVKFRVCDDATAKRFRDAEWDNVVACFVLGKAWQFKGWRWSSPQELFRNVLSFYLGFDDTPLPPSARTWKITYATHPAPHIFCPHMRTTAAKFTLVIPILTAR